MYKHKLKEPSPLKNSRKNYNPPSSNYNDFQYFKQEIEQNEVIKNFSRI